MPTLSRTIRITRRMGSAMLCATAASFLNARGAPPPLAAARLASLARRGRRRSPLVCRIVVAHRSRRTNRGDGVLEDHVIGAAVLDDHGEPIEVLHASLELG